MVLPSFESDDVKRLELFELSGKSAESIQEGRIFLHHD
jgi:hypothetical protein